MGIKKVQLQTGRVFVDLGQDNISSNQMLEGTRVHNATGDIIMGSIPNYGATTVRLSAVTDQNLPSGYYNGINIGLLSDEVNKLIPENIKDGVDILGVTGSFEGGITNVQSIKSITPTFNSQIVSPDNGYSALYNVEVNAIPVRYDETNHGTHVIIG